MYNQIQLDEVCRLHEMGLNDYEISVRLGIPRYTVRRIRIKAGLSPVKRHGHKPAELYRVCDPRTQELLFEGPAVDAAAFLGLASASSFFTTLSRYRSGKYKKYVIEKVTGGEASLGER